MNFIERTIEKVRRNAPLPLPVDIALRVATLGQRAGMALRKLHAPVHVAAKVVSIGNITAGGTGKTPAVIARAIEECRSGRRVAVVTRGYHSPKTAEPLAIAPGARSQELAEFVGDEAVLIARRAQEALVIKSRDRVAGALMAIKDFGCETIILDDGFQSVRLARDEDVVLIDAANPFGNGCLVPRGILREPLTALQRATRFVLTRCDQANDLEALVSRLQVLCPGTPIVRTRHRPCGLWRVYDGVSRRLGALTGRRIRAVCGIGHPEAFFLTLESLGAVVAERRAYPDHGALPDSAWDGQDWVVVTEKDAVRLRNAPENVYALAIELQEM
jgi:tetraacyldisaccharide 4'-kinase